MDETKIDYLETKSFLSLIETKNDLTKYLSNKLANVFSERLICYVTAYGTTCDTNIQDLDPTLFDHSQKEADTSIILHAIDVTKRNYFSDLVIRCSDTNGLLILLYYFNELCSTTIFSTNEHDMLLQPLAEKLNYDLRKGLLGYHSLTGSDQTGKFFGYSKLSCWETYLASSPSTLQAFENLGIKPLDENIKKHITEFVLQLYMKSRPKSATTLWALRWYLFSKNQTESNKLPPTRQTFQQMMMRANVTAMQWKSSHSQHPNLPHPNNYGWKWDLNREIFDPVITANPPAPESIIELTACGCKTGCKSDCCRCRKNKFVCTEMHRCKDCENTENYNYEFSNLSGIDVDDD